MYVGLYEYYNSGFTLHAALAYPERNAEFIQLILLVNYNSGPPVHAVLD